MVDVKAATGSRAGDGAAAGVRNLPCTAGDSCAHRDCTVRSSEHNEDDPLHQVRIGLLIMRNGRDRRILRTQVPPSRPTPLVVTCGLLDPLRGDPTTRRTQPCPSPQTAPWLYARSDSPNVRRYHTPAPPRDSRNRIPLPKPVLTRVSGGNPIWDELRFNPKWGRL